MTVGATFFIFGPNTSENSFIDGDEINSEFFVYEGAEVVSDTFEVSQAEEGQRITLGYLMSVEGDRTDEIISYYKQLIQEDGWVVEALQDSSEEHRLEATKISDNQKLEYRLVLLGVYVMDESITSISVSVTSLSVE
jgi:hypothetical protein